MPENLNQRDIDLLKTAPHQLILEIQDLIDMVISQFVRSGSFSHTDRDEIKQQVNEELLRKIPKIRHQFQGKSLLRTYLSAVVRNICNEAKRKQTRETCVYFDDIIMNETGYETINSLLFEEEVARLKTAIGLYFKQKHKVILCLKLKYKVPFDYEDFRNAMNEITYPEFDNFVQLITPFQACTDVLLFHGLTKLFNKYENKNNSPDALRKWVMLKINELIDVLNGSSAASQFNEETFQILFEISFINEKDVVSKIF